MLSLLMMIILRRKIKIVLIHLVLKMLCRNSLTSKKTLPRCRQQRTSFHSTSCNR
jgi:hypothetical protein